MTTSETPSRTAKDTTASTRQGTINYPLVAAVTIFVAIADQISKQLILAEFSPGQVRNVIPGIFNLTLTYNYGAAFGLWGGLSAGVRELVLGATIVAALLVVRYFLLQPTYQNRLGQCALAGILGGAIGNVIDRFVHGAVVDFLDFYYQQYHWPAFNVADSAICVGVGLLLLVPNPKKVVQQAL